MYGKRLVVWGLLLAVFALGVGCVIAYAGGPPADAKYVGSAKCRACHFKDYGAWRKTKHAKVFAQLQGDERKGRPYETWSGTLGFNPAVAERMTREGGFQRFRLHDFDDPANLYYEVRP